jgi:hypothetical protein
VPEHIEADTLAEIERRCAAASAGPWKSFVERRDHDAGSDFIRTGGDDIYLSGASVADQDFIAHARQDVPLLLAEVRKLRSRLGIA